MTLMKNMELKKQNLLEAKNLYTFVYFKLFLTHLPPPQPTFLIPPSEDKNELLAISTSTRFTFFKLKNYQV